MGDGWIIPSINIINSIDNKEIQKILGEIENGYSTRRRNRDTSESSV